MRKENDPRYDRQVRLWQTGGQTRLQQSHVCIINGNTTSAEILKNLVLPGIGAFTIIDDSEVTAASLSGNFFLNETDIGCNTASSICRNVCELNSDVIGNPVSECLESLLTKKEFWCQFDVVVVTGFVTQDALKTLDAILWPINIALLRVWTCGFYGALRISRYETTVLETHDPSPTFDLRLDRPWPELADYAESFKLDELDDADHAHVPYIVIYLKALQRWSLDKCSSFPLRLPLTYSEKTEFRQQYVERMARDTGLETNFIEASQSIHRALQPTRVPLSIETLFSRSETSDEQLQKNQSQFWLLIRALREFAEENDNTLPLPGVLPDMVSTTSNYVRLQQIYRQKASLDQEILVSKIEQLSRLLSMATQPDPETISTLCKNSARLHASNGSSLLSQALLITEIGKFSELDGGSTSLLVIYFGMLALDQWLEEVEEVKNQTCVGEEIVPDKGIEFERFLNTFRQMTHSAGPVSPAVEQVLSEIFIHKTSRYLNVSSFMGGIAGQEILKIVTAQYVPLDNVYVFDGIKSTSEKWKAL